MIKFNPNIRRLISACLACTFAINQSSLTALALTDIQVGGPLKTDTTLSTSGNMTDITTNTTVKNGEIGVNSFSRFNVGQGDIVNLQLQNSQNKLVNLIFDSSASQINGIVNSYMNGSIGGNILFANPHGFVVGASGVFNVGSLTLMTPKEDSMKELIKSGSFNEENVERLISFSFDDNNYLVSGNQYTPFVLDTGKIEIAGKINSARGINLFSGSEVDLLSGSELNANMTFTGENDSVVAKASPLAQASRTNDYPQKLAMQDGNDIVIVASNNNASKDILSAIVNMNGKVNANGANVIARTEVFQTDKKSGDAKSVINVNDGADINANNIYMNAVSKISDFDKNIIGVSDLAEEDYYGYLGDIADYVVNEFVHLAKVDTEVNINDGAKLTADNNVVLDATSNIDVDGEAILGTLPNFNFSLTNLGSNTSATVKKGASITAKNLSVNATTDLKLDTTAKTTNLDDIATEKNIGSYALGVTITNLVNKAIIENGAKLDIKDNIDVVAKTSSYHADVVKNGLIPVVDKNHGPIGAAMSFIFSNVENKAQMNANASINGKLNVEADYTGNIVSTVAAYSGTGTKSSFGTAEDGFLDGIFTRFSSVDNIKNVITRGNAKYNDIDTAAGVGIISDNVVSSATIGDSSNNIKPEITAGQVQVKSELTDDKSTLYVTGETEQGRTSASGAIAVNYKDLTANANAYGDFILKGSAEGGDALSITAKTDIVHPKAWLDWYKTFAPFFEGDTWSDAFKDVKDHWNSVQTNSVGDYLQYLESLGELKSIIDEGGFDMFKAIDFNNLGAYGFFSTFAQSKANAMAQTGSTKALSGAVGISLFNANANASLDNNSTVTLQTTNANNAGITVSAESDNDVWTAATLMDLIQFTNFLSGATARDGSAYGVGGAFSYSDSNVTARIGEGVTIKKDDTISNSTYGDINVKAVENGNFLTVSAGSSSPDNTGLSGAVGMTVLGDGVVKAAIEDKSTIFGNNVNVSAAKDDNFINAVIAFANGQNSYGFGLSGIILTDSVESYIAGNVTALDSVNVSADYDKFLINANANIGVAKSGSDDPKGQLSRDQIDNYYGLRELFDEESETETTPETSPSTPSNELHWYNFIKKYQAKSQKIQELADQANTDFDFSRTPNPDKETKAYAGGVNLDVANNSVKAQIKVGATVSAENDVKVNANSHDKIIDANAVVAANGKSGAGATIMADVTLNNVEASIGNAAVDAKRAIEVTAGEDYDLIAASAGVAVEKDKAGAGNVSTAIQVNDVTAAIKDGAKINQTATGKDQSVKVEGKVDSKVIKAVGALSVQAGSDSGKSVGATLDADIVSNTINAYIQGATVNASGNIDVNALNTDKMIVVDAAGGVSTSGSAYSGTVGAYVAANDVNSYIENSTVKSSALNLKSSSSFDEIDVVGTVGAGSKTGVGMSVRVDAVINELNSYIKGSTITTGDKLTMTNSDSMSQISVGVGGSASTDGAGGAGVLSVLADVTDQNNYIENSTVNVASLTMDSDKSLDTLSVTGALSVALGGTSVGISAYALGASHNINTYIKNSDIIASNGDIQLTSDFTQDNLSIIFGGAGGKGVTATGALNVLVNDSTLNTYVLNDVADTKKKLHAQNGLIKVASSSDVNSLTIDGNVGISTGNVSAGGAVNTTVNNSTVSAGIKGADVQAGKGVEVSAKSNQKFISTAVGASVGSTGVEGTVDTVVMDQNINSYIESSIVETKDGDIAVSSDNVLNLKSGVGAVAGATGGAGVGGAVQTLVINQTINSEIKNSTLKALKGSIKNQSSSDFDLLATVLGFAGASSAAINGSVATQVLNIKTTSEISSSVLEAAGDILNTSKADSNIDTYIASANGAGTAAIGGVVYSIVDNSSANALINGTNTIKTAKTLNNTATMKSDYLATLFNASGSGTAAVNGTVSTFVLNSQSNSVVEGVTGTNIGEISVQSDNTSKAIVAMLQASGSGEAAVNGGVNTFVSSKKSKAQINNSNITSSGKVTVSANADNKIDSTVVGGAGSGGVAVTGAVNTIVSSDEISAKVSNSSVESADFSMSAKDTLSIVGRTGSLQGAGGVAAGGAIITGVITNNIEALVKNSDITSNKDIIITSVAKETLGDSENPFITIAASGSGSAAVAGAVDTLVLNSSSKAKVSGKKNKGLSASETMKLEGTGNTDIFLAAGGAGGGSVGVGATASTLVIDKDIEAVADSTTINSKDIDIDASSTDNINNVAVAGAIGAATGVSGVVNTTVISSDVKAGISNSEVKTTNDINIDSKVSAKYLNTTGDVAGAGVAGVGASVVTNVVGYNTSAFIDNSTVKANNIAVKSDAATTYELYAISGAVGGEAGVAGVVETNVVNNSVTSYVTGGITADNKLDVNAKDEVTFKGIAGTLAGAGGAGVGATVQTNSVTSTVLSYVGGGIAAADIDVNAEGIQNFNDLSAIGFSGGQVAVNGSALSNIVDATVKSYITKDSKVTSTADLDVTAKNTTTITEGVGSGSLALYASVGASVGVNKITNTTEAYSEDNVTLNAKTADFDAQTTVNLGKEGKELQIGAGSVGVGAGVAGAVLVNDIENKTAAYTGKNNTITASESLSLKAQDTTSVYEKVGALGAGLGAIGASVGVNTIYNTVISSIGQGTTIKETGDVTLSAISNETIVANADVVGGGGVALSGGIIHNTIGKSVDNAQANDLTGDDAKSYDSAKKQSDEVLKASEGYKNDADKNFKKYYNDASNKASSSIADANKNINSSLKESNVDSNVNIEAQNVEQKNSSFSLFTKSKNSGSSLSSTDRNNTTSAFVDSGANVSSKNLTVNAKDTNDVKIDINGNTYGALAVGVSAAVSNVNTTTNAFLSNGVTVNSTGTIDIKAESDDKQNLTVNAASGGIISGNGAVSKANSNKNTNAYILDDTKLTSSDDLSISAKSTGNINSTVESGAYSGVSVGASIADAIITGETKVDIGQNVTLNSSNNIDIKTEIDENASANAKATAGSLVGGSGAEATAQAGKTNTVKIGKNASIIAKLAANLSSIAKNTATAETNGRAYGAVSAGGTKTTAKIEQTSGVEIADADSEKTIEAQSFIIHSSAENNVDAKTKAGAGAVVGVGGSGVYTNIKSTNKAYVGKNYKVKTTDGAYNVVASTKNYYKSFNNSSSYGAITDATAIIENSVNSVVSAGSNADIEANGEITVLADNEVKKEADSNYDLLGGAGAVVGVGTANLTDKITMETNAEFGGDYAHSTGKFDSGCVNIASQSILDVNEKVDVNADGAIPVASGKVNVNSKVTTKTNISNKDVQTKDDDIYYLANSDIKIYTKSNVESYGGIAVADGESSISDANITNSVKINSGVNSVSGRDTFVQSAISRDIQAYMYARTEGAVGAVGGSWARAHYNSDANITIADGAALKSYDSMNLIAVDTKENFTVKRDAKGTTRLLFGIPIVTHGSGHEDSQDKPNASIVLNGSVESGLGAEKKLTIDKNGECTSDGVNVAGKQEVGSVTTEDVQSDIDAYEHSKQNELNRVDDLVSVENKINEDAKASLDKANSDKAELEQNNQNLEKALDIVDKLMENNKQSENVTALENALKDIKPDDSASISKFEETLSSCGDGFEDVKTAFETYKSNQTQDNLTALNSALTDLGKQIQDSNDSSISELGKLTEGTENIKEWTNDNLTTFRQTQQDKINTNKEEIGKCESAITEANKQLESVKDTLAKADEEKAAIEKKYNDIIDQLKKQQAVAEENAIPVYSIVVDETTVRSGEVNITGNVTGNGSITAPGNKFSITVENNSVNDVVYNGLKIDKNAKGDINISEGSTVASSVTQNVKHKGDAEYTITIKNNVDGNDPTIGLTNGYGDMVFMGDIENVNGLVSLVNNTGNILSQGSITTKDLKISVPNGAYTQEYSGNTLQVGGSDGKGGIVASGDIDIASKVIDLNGLVQSGSEIKSLTIPDFYVTKDADGNYWQVVGGVKTLMKAGSTDGYYYLEFNTSGEVNSDLTTIKAYFKPDGTVDSNGNVNGEIYLFKAEIQGGNITLTGNVISSSGNGKIVLVNGYGHIDVTNNSNFDLVTSALNADTKVQGKLTINDFKFSDTDKGGSSFDNLTDDTVRSSDWLKENAGTYTAEVDGDTIKTSSSGKTDGNGSWSGTPTKTTRKDGATVYSTQYTPGSDAYVVTKEGSVETKSYEVYVKRSWWTELWHGKLYKTVYYTVTHDPEYGTAQNAVNVQFQGFDTPEINVQNNGSGSIVLNGSVSALNGDVTLNSVNGNIVNKSLKNMVSAKNIDLEAKGNIGSDLIAIQTSVYGGKLTAGGNNIYINFPYEDISNAEITAQGLASLSTDASLLGGKDSNIKITAETLELKAESGSIDLDASDDDINVKNLKAVADGDISITDDDTLTVQSVVSRKQGTIKLTSKNGSILATDTGDELNPYNINGGDIILSAVNGSVGSQDRALKFARDGIFNVDAKDDVNLSSAGRIYADLIKSESGSVTLDADYGIIASDSNSSDLVYDIFSSKGVNLNTKFGNIENIAINTDGVVNASAGYSDDGIASGLSDISITLISKKELTEEELGKMSAEQQKAAYEEYIKDLKDMKVGKVKASKNVFIHSEKSIVNGNENSSISGEQIVLSAKNGDIGSEDSAINLNANRDISAYAGDDASVYLTSDSDLKINEIRSYKTYGKSAEPTNDDYELKRVVLKTKGNITNAAIDSNKANVSADNVVLNAENNIGTEIKYFNVDTESSTSEDGLTFGAYDAYINGVDNDLNIVSSEVKNNTYLTSDEDITISDLTVGGNLNLSAPDVNIKDMNVKGKFNAFADNLDVHSSNDINIGYVAGRTEDYTNSAKVSSDKSIKNGNETEQDTNIYGKDIELSAGQSVGEKDKDLSLKLAHDNNVTLKSKNSLSVSANGEAGNYSDIETDELDLSADNDVNVNNLKFKNGKVKTKSHNLSIDNMDIEDLGDFTTADKHIIVDNKGFRPHFDADVQLHVTKTPASLKVDSSNNVITEAQNVVRKDSDIFIDGLENYNSMDSTIDVLSEAVLKNVRTGKKTSDTNEEILYGLPTLKAYTQETESAIEGIIRNQLGEFITPENALDSVNISENKRKKFKYFDFSKKEDNKKLSLNDKKGGNYEN